MGLIPSVVVSDDRKAVRDISRALHKKTGFGDSVKSCDKQTSQIHLPFLKCGYIQSVFEAFL
jgi:hypothetical protein